MRTGQIRRFGLIGVIIFACISCEYYLGINQQPEFRNENIEEGLNIFGLLRPDSVRMYNKSFVFVQRIWPVLEVGDYKIIPDLTIQVERIVGNAVAGTIDFPLVPSDSFFTDTLYRPLEHFTPRAGEHYRLTCHYEGLPDAIGVTIIPPEPKIIENSLSVEGRKISFRIAPDSLIGMIDIFLVSEDYSQMLDRIVPSATMEMEIELNLPVDPYEMQLKLFSYDANLAVYNGNSNTSLNFNKYRTTISTLESGYGVFGALNFLCIDL
jgi:hypothetical protein